MRRIVLSLIVALTMALAFVSCRSSQNVVTAKNAQDSKREFRGAWIQTVFQDRYMTKSPQRCREYMTQLIDGLYQAGFNAVIFQVRPEGDAFYPSDYEPWSHYLTGKQGQAPTPKWDPMAYLIELCHSRGMEFHAWLNPYRQTAAKKWDLDVSNIYYQHPEWFANFDGRLYLNPGLRESRMWIRQVVRDIVTRYDIDAVHMDDYFYPYPVAGQSFDDGYAYSIYGPSMGHTSGTPEDRAEFRRRSVDLLIQSLSEDIRSIKPWVRFGISPFGIYRNKKSSPMGSDTNGLQCYDDLYADVLLWAEKGWVDYLIPQLYWEIGHKSADYETLCDWWAKHTPSSCQLYIGQSIERSLDKKEDGSMVADLRQSNRHFVRKINQARSSRRIQGNCFWYAYQVEDNQFHVREFLSQAVFQKPAMPPVYQHKGTKGPGKPSALKGERVILNSGGYAVHLTWQAPSTDSNPNTRARYYNIYRFARGEKVNLSNTQNICGHSMTPEYTDYEATGSTKFTYVITAVDSYNREGRGLKQTFNMPKQ